MPISDNYVVEYLLQGSTASQPDVIWEERDEETACYVARTGDVTLELRHVYDRGGDRVLLRFRHSLDDFTIQEPRGHGWMARKYSSEQDQQLAGALRGLICAAAQQCMNRHTWAAENVEHVRARVYRQLLFTERNVELATALKK